MHRIGLISDTHGLLRPEALAALADCEHIVHGGDIGGPDVLARLAELAPVTAVRGNNDHGSWAEALPERRTLTIAGLRLHVLHDAKQLGKVPNVDLIVAGHSHRPVVLERGAALLVNPGSAGPRRFRLPVSLAVLAEVERGWQVEIVELLSGATLARCPLA